MALSIYTEQIEPDRKPDSGMALCIQAISCRKSIQTRHQQCNKTENKTVQLCSPHDHGTGEKIRNSQNKQVSQA